MSETNETPTTLKRILTSEYTKIAGIGLLIGGTAYFGHVNKHEYKQDQAQNTTAQLAENGTEICDTMFKIESVSAALSIENKAFEMALNLSPQERNALQQKINFSAVNDDINSCIESNTNRLQTQFDEASAQLKPIEKLKQLAFGLFLGIVAGTAMTRGAFRQDPRP